MFIKCVKAFGLLIPGDVTEVPDGASISELWFVECDPPDTDTVTPPFPPAA